MWQQGEDRFLADLLWIPVEGVETVALNSDSPASQQLRKLNEEVQPVRHTAKHFQNESLRAASESSDYPWRHLRKPADSNMGQGRAFPGATGEKKG
ncbi:MAG: hypothetical protein CMN76_12825 [Spirochaetaceae bacterium]|nr:hypothetical protein [Spirochaetaceae bacterium]|tara:strand:+ start:30756 stop:31043 length:288 start_codon:yes stop_codon:yes gene_type:complete